MKTKHLLLVTVVFCAVLESCVTSLHPLYTNKDITYDKSLIGSWKADSSEEVWTLENMLAVEMEPLKNDPERASKEGFKKRFISEKTYLLTYEENGEKRTFSAHLVKLGQHLFLDLYPGSLDLKNSFFADHFMPVHTYAKINVYNNKLELYFLNSERLYKLMNENNIRIKHEKMEYFNLITASTEDLQKFVMKFADQKQFFMNPVVMKKAV